VQKNVKGHDDVMCEGQPRLEGKYEKEHAKSHTPRDVPSTQCLRKTPGPALSPDLAHFLLWTACKTTRAPHHCLSFFISFEGAQLRVDRRLRLLLVRSGPVAKHAHAGAGRRSGHHGRRRRGAAGQGREQGEGRSCCCCGHHRLRPDACDRLKGGQAGGRGVEVAGEEGQLFRAGGRHGVRIMGRRRAGCVGRGERREGLG